MPDDFAPLPPHLKERIRALRKDSTGPEQKLWDAIRGRQLASLKFRRQHPIGPFVADFCCQEKLLVVELDGNSHIGRASYDRDRQDYIKREGYKVLRFDNDEVLRDLETVLMAILKACDLNPFTGRPNEIDERK